MIAFLVVLGASVGAPARLIVARAVAGPRATLLVNVAGSLLLGLFAGLSPRPYALLAIGFCGAFTTFSTFAVEVVQLGRRGGLAHACASVVLCLAAAELGLLVT